MPRGLVVPVLAALLGLSVPASATAQALEGERLEIGRGAGAVVADPGARGGRTLLIRSSAIASGRIATAAPSRLSVRVRGDRCAGAARLRVDVDGNTVLAENVEARTWSTRGSRSVILAGTHRVTVAFTNDYRSRSCDPNLHVDRVVFSPADPNPLASRRLYVDPSLPPPGSWRRGGPPDLPTLSSSRRSPFARKPPGSAGGAGTCAPPSATG